MENAQEVLERNETFLKITVSNFMRKCSEKNRSGVLSREDLMQEVTLCFLSEVERYGEETARTHGRTLFNSMYMAVINAYPLSVPKRTTGFKQITASHLWIDRWENMGERIAVEDTSSMVIDRISVHERLNKLNESDRQIIDWRLEGLSQREIGKRMSLTDVQMFREMKRIRRQFEQT